MISKLFHASKNYPGLMVFLMVMIFLQAGCRNTRDVVFEKTASESSSFVDSLLVQFSTKYGQFIDAFRDTTQFPRTYHNNRIVFTGSSDWTSGFFPGILWNLYRYRGDDRFGDAARRWTRALEQESDNVSTHDVGFIINSSVGLGYELTEDENYRMILIRAAESLASRYHQKPGCIKSLDDFSDYRYPVLIDNLVNLEILFRAWKLTGHEKFYHIAYDHALKTMENHLRKDFTVFQLVDYRPGGDIPVFKGTFQGYDTMSVWSRGQAWGIYGFTTAFRETQDRIFLDLAESMADYLLQNSDFLDGYIPFWDMAAPEIPDELKDASAAAITASAFLDLSAFPEVADPDKYYKAGEQIIRALGDPHYFAGPEENGFFVVKHCVGNLPGNVEVDVPLIYADYYFLEAMLKYKSLSTKNNQNP